MGPAVQRLETDVAALCRARHGIACASGTDALLLPLRALPLRPGDEVITTPFTFFAAAITPRTRAIVPVHLYGQMAALEGLLAVAQDRDIAIVEDAAQAIGARRRIDGQWRMAGELGRVTGFSFFPSKNLGAWGDGGMMVT